MPWNKINYPDSMKKLPAAVRNKAIAIANAILLEKKKTEEGIIIATAIKKAKEIIAKEEKKKVTKSIPKKKAKTVAKKKAKSPAKKKTKTIAAKKVKRPTKIKAKNLVVKKAQKAPEEKIEIPVIESPPTEKITHGNDLHLIPVHGEIHEIGTAEIRHLENTFHQREEVAFHQENQKIKEAMATRKNMKGMSRNRKRR